VLCGGGRATRATPPTTTTRTYECVLLFSPSLFHFQFIWPTRKTATGNSSAFATEVGAWSAVESSFAHLNISITFFFVPFQFNGVKPTENKKDSDFILN
jgi:hypothetical protein